MRYCLLTLGCPKNEVDSEEMARLLGQSGYLPVDRPQNADVLIVNTCGFIDIAIEESTRALRNLAALKRAGQVLIAAGCLAERYAERLRTAVPQIDGVVGTRQLERIVDVLQETRENGNGKGSARRTRKGVSPLHLGAGKTLPHLKMAESTHDSRPPEADSTIDSRLGKASAYLKIADGCSALCAFCTIPQIKGPYHSKPPGAVVEEARRLVQSGAREIVLIAQDTTAYGFDWGERDALADLIPAVLAAVPDLRWLRLMYAYPSRLTDRLIEIMARYPQVCHYLDLPLQHSHPAVLKRMRRPADVDGVRSLIRRLREAMPDIALRTTFIVGFPGETEAEFQTLLEFIEEVAFDRLGVFTYSREEGTAAATLAGQLPDRVMRRRYERAMELQQRISLARNRAQVGRELDVLVEGVAELRGDREVDAFPIVGRTYRDAPEVDGLIFCRGRAQPGDLVRAKVVDALEYDLVGDLLEVRLQSTEDFQCRGK